MQGTTYTINGVVSYVTSDDSTPHLMNIDVSFTKSEDLTTYMKKLKANGYTLVTDAQVSVFNPVNI